MRELICFGEDWGRHPSTGQFLVRHLLDSFRVIWINSLGWRTPRMTAGDLTRIVAKLRSAARGPRRPHPNLTVYTPLVVPLHGHAGIRQLNARLITRAMGALVRRHHFRRYAVMSTYPAVCDVFRTLSGIPRVYYCADSYETMPGLDPATVRGMERAMLDHTDLVVTTSRALYETKSRAHSDVVYLPHGVDVGHFATAADPRTLVPDDLAGLRRPVIGFHGLVQGLIDGELVRQVAERRPAWSFVFVGRLNFDATALPRRPNIHYLGERPYADIPRYLRGFDVCLIPYRVVDRMTYASPIKLLEYLAAGKPVVSTPTQVVLEYEDVVRVGATADEFVDRIERCLHDDPEAPARRMARARPHTWDARSRDLAGLLEARCFAS